MLSEDQIRDLLVRAKDDSTLSPEQLDAQRVESILHALQELTRVTEQLLQEREQMRGRLSRSIASEQQKIHVPILA